MTTIPSISDTLDVDGAAALLRLGRDSTLGLIDSGILPAVRLNTRHCVLLREDVLGYIRAEARRQAAERARGHAPATEPTPTSPRRRGPKRRVLPELAG